MQCEVCGGEILPGEEVMIVLQAIATEPGDSEGSYKDESVEWVGHQHCWNGGAVLFPVGTLPPGEVGLLEKAERGLLPCPRCERPLRGEFLRYQGLYTGVRLRCPGCGFEEY